MSNPAAIIKLFPSNKDQSHIIQLRWPRLEKETPSGDPSAADSFSGLT